MPAFTGAEADAAACFSHGRRFSLLPPHPSSLPLEGFAVLNDTPVACQTRGPTDPQGDRWHGEAVADEASPRSGVSAHYLSPTAPFLPTAEEMGERTPAETTFLHFLSALWPTAISRVFSRA